MAIMLAGAIVLLRRITTCLVLVALVGIYAVPLAAAFSTGTEDCCAAGMCPRPGRTLKHGHAHQEMADCGMAKSSRSLGECKMGACNVQKDNIVNVGLFVSSAPVRMVRNTAQFAVMASAPQSEHTVSQIPETPPPRIGLS